MSPSILSTRRTCASLFVLITATHALFQDFVTLARLAIIKTHRTLAVRAAADAQPARVQRFALAVVADTTSAAVNARLALPAALCAQVVLPALNVSLPPTFSRAACASTNATLQTALPAKEASARPVMTVTTSPMELACLVREAARPVPAVQVA